MIDQNQTTRLLEFLALSPKVFLLFSSSQQLDIFLTTLACYLFFQDVASLNLKQYTLKELVIFGPKKIKQTLNKYAELSDYLESQKLLSICQHDLGRENLLITFPYQAEQVDQVSYQIGDNDQRFYLNIKPKKGHLPLNYEDVEFSYVGSSADLLILFGVDDPSDLKDLYFKNKELYQNTPLISVNNFLPDFGTLNLDISGSGCYGEAVFYLIKNMASLINIELNSLESIKQLATLLLASISLKTNNFSHPKMTSDSFLAVAELLQLGAQRLSLEPSAKANKLIKDSGLKKIHKHVKPKTPKVKNIKT